MFAMLLLLMLLMLLMTKIQIDVTAIAWSMTCCIRKVIHVLMWIGGHAMADMLFHMSTIDRGAMVGSILV